MAQLNSLPDETLLKIFSNLGTEDIISVSRVNHRFNQISLVPSFVKSLKIREAFKTKEGPRIRRQPSNLMKN